MPKSATVTEEYDLKCFDSPIFQALCDKIRRETYINFGLNSKGKGFPDYLPAYNESSGFAEEIFIKVEPAIKAVVYRPATLPATPMPVVVNVHGNFATTGTKLTRTATTDGQFATNTNYTFLTTFPGIAGASGNYGSGTWSQEVGNVALSDVHPSASQWANIKGLRWDGGVPLNTSEVATLLGYADVPSMVTAMTAAAPSDSDLFANTDSYKGYAYLGEALAARGYFVISIAVLSGVSNWNERWRPTTVVYQNTAETDDWLGFAAWARTGLVHLELLELWNTQGNTAANGGDAIGVDLTGKLDLANVGLQGHSRGGLAVRMMQNALHTRNGSAVGGPIVCPATSEVCRSWAAQVGNSDCAVDAAPAAGAPACFFELSMAYADLPQATIKSVLEIGPMDLSQSVLSGTHSNSLAVLTKQGGGFTGEPGTHSYMVNPIDVPWVVMIPQCDFDVNNLNGRCPYDRVVRDEAAQGQIPAAPMAIVTVSGTSHDHYNTNWQSTDLRICDLRNDFVDYGSPLSPLGSQISGTNPKTGEHMGKMFPLEVARLMALSLFGFAMPTPTVTSAASSLPSGTASLAAVFDSAFALPTSAISGFSSDNLNFVINRDFTTGRSLAPDSRAIDIFESGRYVASDGVRVYGGASSTTQSPFIKASTVSGEPPFFDVQAHSLNCITRTTQIEWNGCVSELKSSTGTAIAGTCASSRAPTMDPSVGYYCQPGKLVSASFINWNTEAFNAGESKQMNIACVPALESAPPGEVEPSFDPEITVLFGPGKDDVDVSAYTHVTFSFAREHSQLNLYNDKLKSTTAIGLTGVVGGEETAACISPTDYWVGAKPLGGPAANYISHGERGTRDPDQPKPQYIVYQDSPKADLVANGALANAKVVPGAAPLLTSLSAPATIGPVDKLFYPRLLTVSIPLADLGIGRRATGIKFKLTAAGNPAGAIAIGPIILATL